MRSIKKKNGSIGFWVGLKLGLWASVCYEVYTVNGKTLVYPTSVGAQRSIARPRSVKGMGNLTFRLVMGLIAVGSKNLGICT